MVVDAVRRIILYQYVRQIHVSSPRLQLKEPIPEKFKA